jgi:hypothetical protein
LTCWWSWNCRWFGFTTRRLFYRNIFQKNQNDLEKN